MGIRQYLEEHGVCLLFPKGAIAKDGSCTWGKRLPESHEIHPSRKWKLRQQNGMRAGGASTCNPACPVGKGNPFQRKAGKKLISTDAANSAPGKFPCPSAGRSFREVTQSLHSGFSLEEELLSHHWSPGSTLLWHDVILWRQRLPELYWPLGVKDLCVFQYSVPHRSPITLAMGTAAS